MKILLAVDNSDSSRAAVDQVMHRRWPESADFEVLHVVEPVHTWLAAPVAQELARRANAIPQETVERLEQCRIAGSATVREGDPKSVILDRAKETGADWIVLGAGSLLGGVASAVVRHAPCSVEVIRPRGKAVTLPLKVLFATDGSASSEVAARSIAHRPWPAGTEVRVFTVLEYKTSPLFGVVEPPGVELQVNERVRGDAMQAAMDARDSACGIVRASFPDVSSEISVQFDSPKRVLLAEIEKWGADVVVVGSHGHKGLERFLLGSVSEALANHAKCSVEVVRAKRR